MEIIVDTNEFSKHFQQLPLCWQAAITLQDSCHEVQKFLLQEGEKPQLRTVASLQMNQVCGMGRCILANCFTSCFFFFFFNFFK